MTRLSGYALLAVSFVLLGACAGRPDKTVDVYDTDTGKTVAMTEKAADDAEARTYTKEHVVGTRFPVTTCLTREQAEQRRQASKDDQDLLQRRQAIPPNQ